MFYQQWEGTAGKAWLGSSCLEGLMTQLCSHAYPDVTEDLVGVNSSREENYHPRSHSPSRYISLQFHSIGTSLLSWNGGS